MMKSGFVKNGILFLFICIIYFCNLIEAKAAQQTIRVGCVDIDNFLKLEEDGTASGYGGEYLDEIAKYTNWDYEFRQGSWSECLEWLKSGEIDLLMPAEYSEERAAEYLFSDVECCLDYAALIGRKSEDGYYYEDYEAFGGMAIGMIKDNYHNAVFEQYALDNHFTYDVIYYNTGTELTDALEQGKVDAIVNGNMEYTDSQKVLARIAYMPAYFITNQQNEGLMAELNKSLHQILLNNPYYTANLHDKYYSSVERQSIGFTRQEADYIKEKGTITVLLLDDNYPMEWYDNKTRTWNGIYVDIINLIEKESGLKFEFAANDDKSSPWEAMKDGKADVWGSACVSNLDRAAKDLSYTSFYYDCGYSLVGKKEKGLDLLDALTITVLEKDEGVRSLIQKQHPNWNIVTCKNIGECLEQVQKSKADLSAVSTFNLSVNENYLDRGLIVIDRAAMSLPICFGMEKGGNPLLISVLDKSILKIDAHELDGYVINSVLSIKQKLTLQSLLENYPFYVGGAFIVFFVVILIGIFMIYRSGVQEKQKRILQEKNRELEIAVTIQEQLRIEAMTDALTGLKNKGNGEYTCQKYLDQYPDGNHAILIMDLDNFKQINDTYGHLCGDGILKRFGHILSEVADDKDIVARIGGDEFLMFITCIENKEQVMEQVGKIYAKSSEKGNDLTEMPISCSIGIVISKNPHKKYSELFFDADQVLYEAKKNGKNKFILIEN